MLTLLAFSAALLVQDPANTDGPIMTGGSNVAAESVAEVRLREALAYSNPLPRGAPTEDYALVAWCYELVSGHVALGESLTDPDDLDRDIMRLGRLEAVDFKGALAAARPRQTTAAMDAAAEAAAAAAAQWEPLLAQEDEAVRSRSFGLFFGLPGRCEHAARRIRENITTAPATPEQVGLTREGEDAPR